MKTYKQLAIASLAFVLNLQAVHAQGYDPRHTISVSGAAEVKAIPNEVIISMSVETHNMSLDNAREDNDEKVTAILAMARKYGVEDKFIQTDYLHVEPRYDERYNNNGEPRERKFLGYYMTKSIMITLRDISKFERVVAEALKLGTNYIQGTSFETTELRKYRDRARIDAIKAAKEKAIALAGELGQKVGKPITITEGAARPYQANFKRIGSFNANLSVDSDDKALDENGSVAPGELKIEANVEVTFELE
jgi:uncharacterized protein YggE